MFNYTNTIVINKDSMLDKKSAAMTTTDELVLYRNGNFKKALMSSVKADGTPVTNGAAKLAGEAETLGSIDLSGLVGTTGKDVRILFKIACSAKYAEFALANWHSFEKPVIVEFAGGDIANLEAALDAVLDPDVASQIDPATETKAPGKVFMKEACFSPIFVSAVELEDENGVVNAKETAIAVTPAVTASAEGKGNCKQILANLRYPTKDNLRYNAPFADEMPKEGVVYDLYTFDYTVERQAPTGGLSAVGQKITSKTHFDIYVEPGAAIAIPEGA